MGIDHHSIINVYLSQNNFCKRDNKKTFFTVFKFQYIK